MGCRPLESLDPCQGVPADDPVYVPTVQHIDGFDYHRGVRQRCKKGIFTPCLGYTVYRYGDAQRARLPDTVPRVQMNVDDRLGDLLP